MIKTDGIASAASALRYWERRQEVVTNNLANANTDGFKAERVFARLVGEALPEAAAATDRREGSYRPTGNAFDLAIGGDAFFVVGTPAGEQWSRGGAFQIDANGYLADADGNAVLGERGPVRLTRDVQGREIAPKQVTIDRAGLVEVDGVAVDRLRIERSGTTGSLEHVAGTRFTPDPSRQTVAEKDRDVRQGMVEESNVNPISSLVDLISVQRNFAFAQKVLTTLDGVRSTISNDLAKVSG